MKGDLKAAERLTRSNIKRIGALSENEPAWNNEKGGCESSPAARKIEFESCK